MKKLSRNWLISLLMILSTTLTNATPITKDLGCGGICVPQDKLKRMEIDIIERDEIQKELRICSDRNLDMEYRTTSDSTMWFVAGGALGIFLTGALQPRK